MLPVLLAMAMASAATAPQSQNLPAPRSQASASKPLRVGQRPSSVFAFHFTKRNGKPNPRVKGRRDASLKTRSNRRKARRA